jgi:hypothetical protein
MSERDPIRDLENFGTGGVPVTPLSPAEVRRLGDRRRTRRNAVVAAGTVVAIAAIATPFAFLGGGSDKPTPPSTTVTPTVTPSDTTTPEPDPPGGWRTSIPSDFPIDKGLEAQEDGEKVGPSADAAGINELSICPGTGSGSAGWPNTYVARLGAHATGPEFLDGRELITMPDSDAAQAMLDGIRELVAQCGDGADDVWTVISGPAVGDETLALTHLMKVGLGGDVYVFTRVGNAILAVDGGGEWAPETASLGLGDLTATARPIVDAMCIYAADPCGESGDPTGGQSGGTSGATTTIPSDFPIDLGSPDLGSEATVNGAPAGERMTHADPCDSKGILVSPAVDRLDYDLTGPEFSEMRELRTYADAATAQAALDNLSAAAAGCATETLTNGIEATWTVLDEQTGYHSVTVARTIGTEGGYTWQYTRVGLAIFGVVWSGEGGSPEQIRINSSELTAITKQVAPKMCPFTQAGC